MTTPRGTATTTIAELEAALQARWDRDVLAVYADALLAAGDPRGELIALDLHADRHGLSDETREAKRRALAAWLGDEAPRVGAWQPEAFRFGLLDDFTISSSFQLLATDYLDALLDSPAGDYLRGVTIFDDARGVTQSLARLAARPLPWLARISIDKAGSQGPAPIALTGLLGDAAPHLRELHVRGDRVVATPLPRSIHRLRIEGRAAVVVARDGMPGVTELDLAFHVPNPGALRALVPLVNPRSFPDLVRLDLARNEPMYPTSHPSNVDPLAFVAAIEAPERLRWLRLPSLRGPEQAEAVLALLARCPALEVELARGYQAFASVTDGLAHPRLRVPPPRPWPPADQLSSRAALTVRLPVTDSGDEPSEDLALASCADRLEAVHDELPPAARAGWLALWRALDDLPYDTDDGATATMAFPAAVLAAALAPAALRDTRCAAVACLLRDAGLPPDATVTLERFWGW